MIDWTRFRELVVLTGAGVSVASGLGTYRGKGGLWERAGVAQEATADCMQQDPWRCWKFFQPLMEEALKAEPNPAHLALAELEKKFRGEFLLITQNVDGLHRAAGSTKLAEIHGNLLRRRCSSSGCALIPFEERSFPSDLPLCPLCGSAVRPDIVLFDLQVIVHSTTGDAFYVTPLPFSSKLKTHKVEQFDIDLASPEAQLLEKFWLHIFQQKNKNQQDAIQSISELESAIGNGGNWHVVGAKALAVGIDLSDLGVPEGQTVDGIFLQDALDNQDIVDPVFIAGFPPLKHTTEK